MGINNQGDNKIVAVSNSPSNQETFQIIRKSGDLLKIRIKASNGLYWQVLIIPSSSYLIWKFLTKLCTLNKYSTSKKIFKKPILFQSRP